MSGLVSAARTAVLARNHRRLSVKVGLSRHKRLAPHAEEARAGPLHLFHVPARCAVALDAHRRSLGGVAMGDCAGKR